MPKLPKILIQAGRVVGLFTREESNSRAITGKVFLSLNCTDIIWNGGIVYIAFTKMTCRCGCTSSVCTVNSNQGHSPTVGLVVGGHWGRV
jgi:hypothetical protein